MPRKALFLLAVLGLILAACGDGKKEAHPTLAGGVSQAVSFQTADGVTIRGHLFGEGDTLVILAHMRPSDQTSWYGFAEELAKAGYSALTFDFRGYGESEGSQELSKIDLDVEAAIETMRAKGYDTIYLVGASMGGTASLIAAARQEVAGVVAISAPAQFEGLDAEAVVGQVSERKLFIASKGDTSAMTSLQRLFEGAPEPKEEKVFEGSDHGTNLLEGEHAVEAKALITAFLSGQ
jgi:alpha/beta superfamily hydrolase